MLDRREGYEERGDDWLFDRATGDSVFWEAKDKANLIVCLLLAFGLNDQLVPDGNLGTEFDKAIAALEAMPDDSPRKMVMANFLMDLLYTLDLNDKLAKDGHDSSFGDQCRKAIANLKERLATEADGG